MTISDIQKDTIFWQRMLRLAGYYTGKIDGISGKLTRKAEDAWLTASSPLILPFHSCPCKCFSGFVCLFGCESCVVMVFG